MIITPKFYNILFNHESENNIDLINLIKKNETNRVIITYIMTRCIDLQSKNFPSFLY